MFRQMFKSKIHRAVITDANLNYEGSITIDKTLMDAADIYPYERVQIVNLYNGSRAETYVIEGEADSGVICMNGAIARLAQKGDLVIIISYILVSDETAKKLKPIVVNVDSQNKIVR